MYIGPDIRPPGTSSLRGQGHLHFAKGTFIVKSESLRDTFEGAPRPRPGATEAIALVASAYM